MNLFDHPHGASVLRTIERSRYPAARQGRRWFHAPEPLTPEAARSVETLQATIGGAGHDLTRVECALSAETLRQLRAAASAVRALVNGEAVPDARQLCELLGDYGPTELTAGQPVVAIDESFAWRWPLSRLRWLLWGEPAALLRSLQEGPERAVIRSQIGWLDGVINRLAQTHAYCA